MPFSHTSKLRSVDPRKFGVARQRSGAVTADSGPFDFASFPQLLDDDGVGIAQASPVAGVFLGGAKHDSILIGACFTGDGSVRIVPRMPDEELELWIPFVDNAGTKIQSPALSSMKADGGVWEFWNYGNRVFFFISNVTDTVTDLEIVVRPGKARVNAFYG
jgi:hypothetical protein